MSTYRGGRQVQPKLLIRYDMLLPPLLWLTPSCVISKTSGLSLNHRSASSQELYVLLCVRIHTSWSNGIYGLVWFYGSTCNIIIMEGTSLYSRSPHTSTFSSSVTLNISQPLIKSYFTFWPMLQFFLGRWQREGRCKNLLWVKSSVSVKGIIVSRWLIVSAEKGQDHSPGVAIKLQLLPA